jgi:hypothetical protein
MNKEQQQIIDEVYNNYWEETFKSQGTEWVESLSGMSLGTGELTTVYRQYTKKDLIEKIKTDIKFSEKFKLKIEERELSLEERTKYKMKRDNIARTIAPYTHQILNNSNVPTLPLDKSENVRNRWRKVTCK